MSISVSLLPGSRVWQSVFVNDKSRLFPLALLAAATFWAAPLADAAQEMRSFVVSAYYSPLPDQKIYMRGSYEADVRLNGNGTNGASGKEVFPGMLAAPKTYGFGTKIWLKGIGLGTVHDRGGAIVPAGKRGHAYDRIDVWMGEGEVGLRRALTWGVRTVQGMVITPEIEKKLGPNAKRLTPIELSLLPALKNVRLQGPVLAGKGKAVAKVSPVDPFAYLNKNSPAKQVLALRQALADLGYLEGAGKGVWDGDLTDALAAYQVDEKLVPSAKHPLAGTYGPKTRAALKKDYAYLADRAAEYRKIAAQVSALEEQREKRLAKSEASARKLALSVGTPKPGSVGANVRTLQLLLKESGHFDGKDTAIFGPSTRAALAAFQKSAGLVKSDKDVAAGRVGKRTLAALADAAALRARASATDVDGDLSEARGLLARFEPEVAKVAARPPLLAMK